MENGASFAAAFPRLLSNRGPLDRGDGHFSRSSTTDPRLPRTRADPYLAPAPEGDAKVPAAPGKAAAHAVPDETLSARIAAENGAFRPLGPGGSSRQGRGPRAAENRTDDRRQNSLYRSFFERNTNTATASFGDSRRRVGHLRARPERELPRQRAHDLTTRTRSAASARGPLDAYKLCAGESRGRRARLAQLSPTATTNYGGHRLHRCACRPAPATACTHYGTELRRERAPVDIAVMSTSWVTTSGARTRHCYHPLIDHVRSEAGCYDGRVATRGTSRYCHLTRRGRPHLPPS